MYATPSKNVSGNNRSWHYQSNYSLGSASQASTSQAITNQASISQANVSQASTSRQAFRRMTDVNMPTGIAKNEKTSIVVPARSCECNGPDCKPEPRLRRLTPDGQMGSREYHIVAKEMADTIVQHHKRGGGGMFSSYNILEIVKVQNCCLWRKFRNREREIVSSRQFVNERMLFHGSSAAQTIVKSGFDLNFANPDHMFGAGIYFAENSSKSNQYVFGHQNENGCPTHGRYNCYKCEREVLLCRVALGCMYMMESGRPMMTRAPQGRDSVKGEPSPGGLNYPEYVIYDANQAYPEYLIRYKIVR